MNSPGKFFYTAVYLCIFVLSISSVAYAEVRYGISVGGNRDYPGGDYLTFITDDLDVCVKTCADNGRCKAFAYNPQTQVCHLKDVVPEPINKRGIKSGRKVSGLADNGGYDSSKKAKMKVMRKINLPGQDYVHFKAKKSKNCSNKCLKDPNCKAFSFNQTTRICWLKAGKPQEQYQENIVSGFKYW